MTSPTQGFRLAKGIKEALNLADDFTLDAITVATGDRLLVWDVDNSNELSTATAQSIADLAAGGGMDTDAIHDNVASEISAITNKATPVAGDFLVIEDSAAANVKKHILLSDLLTFLDGSYLLLDASNDPVTDDLKIGVAAADASSPTVGWDKGVRTEVDPGNVNVPDAGKVTFGTGNRVSTIDNWYDCSIQFSPGNGMLLNPADGAISGASTSASSVIISQSGQSGGDGRLEVGDIQVNSYLNGLCGIQMLSASAGGANDSEIRFGVTTQNRATPTDVPPEMSIHYDIANDDRLVIEADISAARTPIVNFLRAGGVQILKGDLALSDTVDITASTTGTGTAIGTGTTQLLGFWAATPIVQPSALTAALTQVTHTAPGTPDYAFADTVDSGVGSAWGFSTHDEANTLLSVVKNLQTRVDQLEAALSAAGGGSGLIA